ncbi:hypothetical protein GGI12_002226 [Dipsacomyces acuminosporus]|nr:hypothetical protein GGI12_002226 [Dipsacomyces acuminosporus]
MSLFDQIKREVQDHAKVEDAAEETCELYSVYYSTSGAERLDFVDASARELEVEIHDGKRGLTLNIAQNPNINGELGQTGAVLWNSSVVMSRFFAQKSTSGWDLANLNAIELGSGCGLVGLVLHRLGAKRVVLTDQARMMRLLNKNVESCKLQSSSQKRKTGAHASTSEVIVAEYEWGYPPTDPRILEESVDLVVASDCVYHESVAPLLASTLVHICQSREGGGGKVVAVIGQELRSDLVHQAFIEQLLKDFVVYRMSVSESVDSLYALYLVWLK